MNARFAMWGGPNWVLPAIALTLLGLVVLGIAYRRAGLRSWIRVAAATLKVAVLIALALVLLEPFFSGVRPRPGANLLFLMADDSQSLQLHDAQQVQTRGEQMREQLAEEAEWRVRVEQDFDVRHYTFDKRVRAVSNFDQMQFQGGGSAIQSALHTIRDRYRGRPVAGAVVFTDGNATDMGEFRAADWRDMPPVYFIAAGEDSPARDVRVENLSVSQSNFESAPVSIQAEIATDGVENRAVEVQLLDEEGEVLQTKSFSKIEPDVPAVARFQVKPEEPGIRFYRVRAFMKSEGAKIFADHSRTKEATLANNTRVALVDRGGGPYRILYVSGRPNWEYKFLRRAVEDDDEIQLVGLVRIAKREPKFDFRSRQGETTNPLFRGFGNQGDELAEQYDQPVLLRLGTEDEDELRDGFPKTADELFRYHAVVLDDVEVKYFTQDQMLLLQQFVSFRGGGMVMLGGQESFAKGGYSRTPLGDLLPVYLGMKRDVPPDRTYRLRLTRDGMHPPWSFFRVRSTMEEEQSRLLKMPSFQTVNRVDGVKPGAVVLAVAESTQGETLPAFTAQRFGKGRAAAMLVGDLWRWGMRRESATNEDLGMIWRQTMRWIVADVPRRVDARASVDPQDPDQAQSIEIEVRDNEFKPLDNAQAHIEISTPTGTTIEMDAEPSESKAGAYVATFVPRDPGAYRAHISVTAPDGSETGQRDIGWVSEPQTAEFRRLCPNRELMSQIADATGGEVLALDDLNRFAATLPNRKIPVTEAWLFSWWERKWIKLTVFLLIVACLSLEWAARRFNGLP